MESDYVSHSEFRIVSNNLQDVLHHLTPYCTMSNLERVDTPRMTARLTLTRAMPLRDLSLRFALQIQSVLDYLELRIRAILRKIVASPDSDRSLMVRPLYLEVVSTVFLFADNTT